MRRALVASAILIVVAGLAWGVWREQAEPVSPELVEHDRAKQPLGQRPGARCRVSEADAALAAAATAIQSLQPDAFGLRRLDDVVVLPRSVFAPETDHGLQFGYASEGTTAYGFRIHGVRPGSLGHALGFRHGDVVGESGRDVIGSLEEGRQALARFQADGVGCLRVLRDGRWRPRWFVLEDRVAAEAP